MMIMMMHLFVEVKKNIVDHLVLLLLFSCFANSTSSLYVMCIYFILFISYVLLRAKLNQAGKCFYSKIHSARTFLWLFFSLILLQSNNKKQTFFFVDDACIITCDCSVRDLFKISLRFDCVLPIFTIEWGFFIF